MLSWSHPCLILPCIGYYISSSSARSASNNKVRPRTAMSLEDKVTVLVTWKDETIMQCRLLCLQLFLYCQTSLKQQCFTVRTMSLRHDLNGVFRYLKTWIVYGIVASIPHTQARKCHFKVRGNILKAALLKLVTLSPRNVSLWKFKLEGF